MRIIHAFADEGVESEWLAKSGSVFRVGLDTRRKGYSVPINADATRLPFRDGTFYFGLFHPPCQRWSRSSWDRNAHPDLLEKTRDEAERLCDYYVIENVPEAPLRDPIVLEGDMFGCDFQFRRAFETNFSVDEPPPVEEVYRHPLANSRGGYKEDWARAKGYSMNHYYKPLVRTAVPVVYLEFLTQNLRGFGC